jgi:hypothetical protein
MVAEPRSTRIRTVGQRRGRGAGMPSRQTKKTDKESGTDSRPRHEGELKNKYQKGGVISGAQKATFFHHVYHAFHHKLTIKKPRSAHRFS